ncbi:MAG: hypothetical protein LBH67_03145 [Rickettsia sp.]|nr:hypothetical protein [Rickettsia sp.]
MGKGKTPSGQTVEQHFYLHPKHLPNSPASSIGIIGGTFIEGASPATPNTDQFKLIMQRAREFYGLKD